MKHLCTSRDWDEIFEVGICFCLSIPAYLMYQNPAKMQVVATNRLRSAARFVGKMSGRNAGNGGFWAHHPCAAAGWGFLCWAREERVNVYPPCFLRRQGNGGEEVPGSGACRRAWAEENGGIRAFNPPITVHKLLQVRKPICFGSRRAIPRGLQTWPSPTH